MAVLTPTIRRSSRYALPFVQCRPYKILKGVSHVTIKVKERKQAGKSIAAAAAKELAPEAV